MVTKSGSRVGILGSKNILALLAVLMGFALLAFWGPVAKADTSDDLARALTSQKYYVSSDVKANPTFMNRNSNVESSIKDEVNKVKGKADTRIAVISNAIIPAQYNNNTESYGNFLYATVGRPDVLIVVNAQAQKVSLFSDELTTSERQQLISETTSAFTANETNGTVQLAEKAVDKISGNKTGSLITTVVIVLVVIVAVLGLATFLLISTKNKWIKRVNGVEQMANQVSDQVVKVSDDINFLPDAARATTDAEFGTATRNFSEANTKLSELRGVSPVQLLLKGADYDRQLNLTAAQFQEAGRSLSRVGEQVRRALP